MCDKADTAHMFYHSSAIPLLTQCKIRIDSGWVPMQPFVRSRQSESNHPRFIIVAFSARHAFHQQATPSSAPSTTPASKPNLIYVDVPRTVLIGDLIEYGLVHGVFYQGDEPADIQQGLQRITLGEIWFSRKLSNQLLSYFNSIIVRHAPPHKIYLTQRETQVLSLLRRGSSNTKLADSLCLSEHTIKSHLYRIYKKLQVNSRQQAAEWAHHYLKDGL